ncbi:hypothetical protein ACHQM5_010437 [Ranunculus cassubicifolius]
MEAPNMASMSALEKSFQNCSLNRSTSPRSHRASDSTEDDEDDTIVSNTSLELNSHISLPYQWEQCLDLKTGEIYYINWADGTKKREDPRMKAGRFHGGSHGGDCYYSQEEDEDDEDNSYDSDGSSSSSTLTDDYSNQERDHVLVVAGCKTCMMYFMLPKRVQECPKCTGFLLHFDRLENESL